MNSQQEGHTKAVVFLGNPGSGHRDTRHNAAWMLADRLSLLDQASWQKKFQGRFTTVSAPDSRIHFLKPETWMNLSGRSVQAMITFFRLHPDFLLVVHDDIEMEFGLAGWKKGGGLAGHNGLKSIAQTLGRKDFHRFRLGVSRPQFGDVSSHVLGKFNPQERERLPGILDTAAGHLVRGLTRPLHEWNSLPSRIDCG